MTPRSFPAARTSPADSARIDEDQAPIGSHPQNHPRTDNWIRTARPATALTARGIVGRDGASPSDHRAVAAQMPQRYEIPTASRRPAKSEPKCVPASTAAPGSDQLRHRRPSLPTLPLSRTTGDEMGPGRAERHSRFGPGAGQSRSLRLTARPATKRKPGRSAAAGSRRADSRECSSAMAERAETATNPESLRRS